MNRTTGQNAREDKGNQGNGKDANAFMEHLPVGSLMRKFAIPCIISLLVGALYNIVDQIFIANASYLGSYGNAANNVVYPLTVVALALAVLVGDGACTYVSHMLGSGNEENAHRTVGNAVVLVIVISILLTAIYLLVPEQLLTMFGGRVNEETFRLAKEYFFYIALGVPFYMFGQAMNPIIRSDGSPRFAMASTVLGAVTNIIFDPIFIYGFRWGMMGAAVATVMGQVLTAFLAIWYLMHMKAVHLRRNSFALSTRLIGRFVPLGGSSLLSQLSLVAAMAAGNNMIRIYGGKDVIFSQAQYAQIPMAVVGIVMKYFQIVISICVGTAAGCIPIVGYNMGAKRKDRVRKMFQMLLIVEFLVGLTALTIVEFLPGQLLNLFGAANESVYYKEFGIKAFRIYLCLMPLATVNKGTFIFIQAMGKALTSTALSMVREVVFGVGLVLLLPVHFGLDGVLYSMPLSDFLTFVITVIVIIRTMKSLVQFS